MTGEASQPLRIALVGPGAVGLAVASCLIESGARVRVVARAESTRALRRDGLGKTGLFGDHRATPGSFGVTGSIATLGDEPVDWILVTAKTFESEALAAELARAWPSLPGEPRVVLFHNGWGSADLFAEALPSARVYSARVITGFRRSDATTSEITVHQDAIRLGSLFGADLAPLEPLADALRRGGLPCEVSADVSRDLIAKLLYNCALNPLGALCRVPYGKLAEDESTRDVMRAVVREVFAVMKAGELTSWWESPEAYLDELYANLLPPTAAHESSTLQDLRAGRRTEIDFLSGAVVALGRRHGVPAPVNEALWQLVRAIGA